MSIETLPITPSAFAEAIKELALPVLYAKVAELRNSITHLQRSNRELQAFITESCESEADKQEIKGYVAENELVHESMNERIRLCKAEVEGRGQRWIELELETGIDEGARSGIAEGQGNEQEGSAEPESTAAPAVNGAGSSTDAPSSERPRGRGDGGVYL